MISIKKASEILMEKYPKYKIQTEIDYKDFYVFSLIPKDFDLKRDKGFVDGFYAVDKNNGSISEFAPWANEDFLEEMSNRYS